VQVRGYCGYGGKSDKTYSKDEFKEGEKFPILGGMMCRSTEVFATRQKVLESYHSFKGRWVSREQLEDDEALHSRLGFFSQL